jgi:hypothetical protein
MQEFSWRYHRSKIGPFLPRLYNGRLVSLDPPILVYIILIWC